MIREGSLNVEEGSAAAPPSLLPPKPTPVVRIESTAAAVRPDIYWPFVARPSRFGLPAAHPVPLPSLILIVTYPTVTLGRGVTLASGGEYSGHADFFNTWNQKALQQRRGLSCGVPHYGRH